MRMNKVMKGTALTALAAATWLAAGTTDADAAATAANPLNPDLVTVDTYSQTLRVDVGEGNATEIIVGIGTYNEKNKAVKVPSWDIYEAEEWYVDDGYEDYTEGFGVGNVDLSKLNNTKDSYIAVKTDKTDPIYIKIPAAVKSQKAKYNAGTSQLTIDNIKKGTGTAKAEELDWQYRTSYGSWKYFELYDYEKGVKTLAKVFEEFQQQGATLYVRTGNTYGGYMDEKDGWHNMKSLDEVKDAADKSQTPVTYPLYEAGSFPGKESKVSIKKQANGPSVSVNYVKNQIKLPKDTEYRMLADSKYYYSSDYKTAPAVNTQVDIAKFFGTTSQGAAGTEIEAASGVIEVRKAADTAKGKSASKWTLVSITKPVEMEGVAVDAKQTDAINTDKGIVTTKSAVSFTVTGGSISVQYTFDTKGKYKGTVEFKNSAKVDLDVIIKTGEPGDTDKAVTVKANASKKIKAANGNTIYIRVAGNKKEKTFAGKYTFVAKTIY